MSARERDLIIRLGKALGQQFTKSLHVAQRVTHEHLGYCSVKGCAPDCTAMRALLIETAEYVEDERPIAVTSQPYWQDRDGNPLGRYRTIVADPPWPYDEGWPAFGQTKADRRALPYPSMSVEEIEALPVRQLAEPEGYLFLWTTNRYLEAAFRVARAWTFTPRQVLTWCKEPMGEGPGGMFATTTEFVLIAQRIGPRSHARGRRTNGVRIPSSWFQWKRGAHSQKPDSLQALVEQVSPGPYVELFARRCRAGWDAWGNEVPDALPELPMFEVRPPLPVASQSDMFTEVAG